jgi:magnesium/cobalt transport protein CorA
MTGVLGERPSGALLSSEPFGPRLAKRKAPLAVLNDEAHHTHEEGSEWTAVIRRVHESLTGGVVAQFDFSATPRYAKGGLFTWTVYDYPLKQAIIDNIVDRYFPIVDALEVGLEGIEDHIFEGEAGEKAQANMRALYRLKHKGMTVRHAVEPLIEGIHKLYGGRVPAPCATTQEYFRDVYDHLLRISTQLDGLRDMVATAMQVNISMISLAENAVTKRLAAYGALLAVPTMLVGVWGMNFKHMPELEWTWGYPLSIVVMAVIDALLWRRFRRIGWL